MLLGFRSSQLWFYADCKYLKCHCPWWLPVIFLLHLHACLGLWSSQGISLRKRLLWGHLRDTVFELTPTFKFLWHGTWDILAGYRITASSHVLSEVCRSDSIILRLLPLLVQGQSDYFSLESDLVFLLEGFMIFSLSFLNSRLELGFFPKSVSFLIYAVWKSVCPFNL